MATEHSRKWETYFEFRQEIRIPAGAGTFLQPGSECAGSSLACGRQSMIFYRKFISACENQSEEKQM